MTQTPRHGLPLLDAGQAQKEVTHNEALLAIDARLQTAVETRSLSVPPPDPTTGASYIVPDGASGAWAGKRDMIASWDGYGWRFATPGAGWLAWIADEAAFAVHDSGWSTGGWPVDALRIAGRTVLGAPAVPVSAPAGGAIVDSECRAALGELLSVLRNQGLVL